MKNEKKKRDWSQVISYTSDVVMFVIIIVWVLAIIYTGVLVWNYPDNMSNLTDLVKIPVEFTVGGYFGRIALTHFMTISKTGHSVAKDIRDVDSGDTASEVDSEEAEG